MLLATNIGQANIESVNQIRKGHDYGWPMREGRFALHASDINFVYPLPANDAAYNITYPILQYDHDEGKAISGGFEYTGTAVPQLRGMYLFGDVPTGRLFYADLKNRKPNAQAVVKEWHIKYQGKTVMLHTLCGTERVDLHFGKDAQGEVYLLTKPDGRVYKLAQ
jgi:glucose/arabinose dehydrogenase